MNKLLIFLLSLVVISCSDAKKLQRIENRHPDWLKPNNPITVHDTTIVNSIQSDTTFILTNRIDTFTVTKDRLTVKLIHIGDTVNYPPTPKAMGWASKVQSND